MAYTTERTVTETVTTVTKALIMAVSLITVIQPKATATTNLPSTTIIHIPLITATTIMTMNVVTRDIMKESMIETNERMIMTKKYTGTTVNALSMAILLTIPTLSWADHGTTENKASVLEKPHTSAHWSQARQISKGKQQQLMKEAVEAVMETENALSALNNKKAKEALLNLNNVSAKLRGLLAKDSHLKLVPVSFQEQTLIFEGDLDKVIETANLANELIEDHRIQQARQLLDGLTSEIRINIVELPLGEYPAAIEKASRLITAGNEAEAKNTLEDVLDMLVTHAEIYPLPVLAAEEYLTEAYELEHKTDLSKKDSKENILKLADNAENELKLAEALGYGEKSDYEILYEGIQALRDTLHTNKFKAAWDKVKGSIRQLKEKVIHSA
ncbi:MAG TPA: YfdX family protein [Methylobacter sp.]|jgi:hypothetical protein